MTGQARNNGDDIDGMTLDEIGKAFDVTGSRIAEIQNKALWKLRNTLSARGIDPEDVARLGTSGEPVVGTYLRTPQCVDCLVGLPDTRCIRCASCRQYATARDDGYADATFARRAFENGVAKILRRWPGTTT